MTPRIPIGKIIFHGNEREYVAQAMDQAQISSQGPFVERFEAEFARYVGTRYAISTCNGTAALHLMLAALGISEPRDNNYCVSCDEWRGKPDEVIVPALTFPATANMVRLAGGMPVLCDVDPRTWTLDPVEVEKKITPQTKAIMRVSLYGCPADYDELRKLCWNNMALLEDGAQGVGAARHEIHPDAEVPIIGARFTTRKVGNLAFATTFSFYGNKTLTTGEGGMVTTNNDDLAARMRLLRAHGEDPKRKFWFPELGFNYRMSNLHAAIGCAQLERIEEVVRRRNEIAAGYIERLKPLIADRRIRVQPFGADFRHAWWLFSLALEQGSIAKDIMGGGFPEHSSIGIDRDSLRGKLAKDGIETRPIFYPLHFFPMYQAPLGTFPVAEHIGLNGLSLPTFEDLTSGEQDYICEKLIHHMEAMGL